LQGEKNKMENKIKKTLLGILVGTAMTANVHALDYQQKMMQTLGVTNIADIQSFQVKDNSKGWYHTTGQGYAVLEVIGQMYAGVLDTDVISSNGGEKISLYQRTNSKAVDLLGNRSYEIIKKATREAYKDADKNKDKIVTNEEAKELESKINESIIKQWKEANEK